MTEKKKVPANKRKPRRQGEWKPTLKQRKFIKNYLETGNATQSAKDAGYSSKTAADIGKDNLLKPDIQIAIQKYIDLAGLTDDVMAKKVFDGANAMETKFFQKDGEVIQTVDVIPWKVRLDYLEFAAKLKGHLIEKVVHSGGVDLFLHPPTAPTAQDYRRLPQNVGKE